jgi:hypothetical protein
VLRAREALLLCRREGAEHMTKRVVFVCVENSNRSQMAEAFGMAERFFQAGEGRPLLDWLQERPGEVAAEVERVRRLAAR